MTDEELHYIIINKRRHRQWRDKWDMMAYIPPICFALLGTILVVSYARSYDTAPLFALLLGCILCLGALILLRFTYRVLKANLAFTSPLQGRQL